MHNAHVSKYIFSKHVETTCARILLPEACSFYFKVSAMTNIADKKLRASGSNMLAHVVHALYSSFFFCKTPLIWLCMKAVAKDLGCVLLPYSE